MSPCVTIEPLGIRRLNQSPAHLDPPASHSAWLGVVATLVRLVRRNRVSGIGLAVLVMMFAVCLATLPWSLGRTTSGAPRYDEQNRTASLAAPGWHEGGGSAGPRGYLMGTDVLGRDLFVRCLAGGGVSLTIGLLAASVSVVLGTAYGLISGWAGGRLDAGMMRVVDVLYGLPYVLLVVLLAVASDALLDEYISRSRARQAWMTDRAMEVLAVHDPGEVTRSKAGELLTNNVVVAEAIAHAADGEARLARREVSAQARTGYDVLMLLLAIGSVSWLTLARVVRGQVMSLKAQPFVEAARAVGAPTRRIILRHILPNLIGIVIVYATLTVPQAILQESFLSFLGIGVKPPLPSWGNLAAEGISQLNPVKSHWWLLLFPCALIAVTLLALNFVGEGLREMIDPRRRD